MLVKETLVFKASASAWPKAKHHGSRSRVTSVRRLEIQMRQKSLSVSAFPKNTSHWIQGKCHWHSDAFPAKINNSVEWCRKHVTSYHTEWQIDFNSKSHSPTHSQSTRFGTFWNLEMRRISINSLQENLESWDTEGLHSLVADGIFTQFDACHGRVRLQNFS